MFGVNYNGLRKRASYGEIVNLLATGKTKHIKNHDRRATRILNSPQILSIINGATLELEEQQKNIDQQHLIDSVARFHAGRMDMPFVQTREAMRYRIDTGAFQTPDGGSPIGSPRVEDRHEELTMALQAEAQRRAQQDLEAREMARRQAGNVLHACASPPHLAPERSDPCLLYTSPSPRD